MTLRKFPLLMRVFVFFCVSIFWLMPNLAEAQEKGADEVATEIGFDQAVLDKKADASGAKTQSAPAKEPVKDSPQNKIMMINESLKNAIEENKKLLTENKTMEQAVKELRGSSEINANRINFLSNQRDDLQKRLDDLAAQNKKYSEQMERLEKTSLSKEEEYKAKLSEIESQIAKEKAEGEKVMAKILPGIKSGEAISDENRELEKLKKEAQENLADFEDSAKRLKSEVSKLSFENKKLKLDAAKLHYNTANIFFERGDYQRAAREYKKVLSVSPSDADAHYNLAFVSAEFLNDPATALTHYQQYLFFRPYAEDVLLVQEKILDAKLKLKMEISSPIDRGSDSGLIFK